MTDLDTRAEVMKEFGCSLAYQAYCSAFVFFKSIEQLQANGMAVEFDEYGLRIYGKLDEEGKRELLHTVEMKRISA